MYTIHIYPYNKVHGTIMGPIWGRQDPGGPHVGPMNFAIWVTTSIIQHRILRHTISQIRKMKGYVTGIRNQTRAFIDVHYMITSSNGNILGVTGRLCGEITGHRWIPPHKGLWRGALMFSYIYASINGWVNNREAGDLRRHHAHYEGFIFKTANR